ncbi:MAG: hypothetical protein JO208_04260 [Alphaproteobacteria bacterium]|nr:hypothetical protein [Alphaproteobacteria bacterium]
MTSRVLIAGALGGIAMYIWSTIAHVALPLGQVGFSQMPNEAAVLSAARASNGDKDGLYFFPWVDPKDPQMMQKMDAAMKAHPSGLLLYHPPGHGVTDMAKPMIIEFVKEVLQASLAAFLLSLAGIPSYWRRAGFVAVIGIIASITTNLSYWLWYGFPADYSLAAVFIEFMDYVAAGLAIAWWLGRRPATLPKATPA